MKTLHKPLLLLLAAVLLTGCAQTYYASEGGYGSDDLYGTHDQAAISRRKQAQAEAARAEAEARRAQWEALLAEAEAAEAEAAYRNSYSGVLADTYESAYARRLRGLESGSYNMPSSYDKVRYSSKFHYLSAYDPAYYNIIVVGDQAWVEPKYITAMFGTLGRPSTVSLGYAGGLYDSWYFSWGYNPYSWQTPYYAFGWGYPGWGYPGWVYPGWGYPGWGWGWDYGWGWHHPHPGWGPGWGHGGGGDHRHPGRVGQGAYHRPGTQYIGNRRPNAGSTSFNRGNGGSTSLRNGSGIGSRGGSSQQRNPGNRGSSTYRNPSQTDRSNSSGNSGSSFRNNSGSSYRGGSTPSGSSSGSYNRGSSGSGSSSGSGRNSMGR